MGCERIKIGDSYGLLCSRGSRRKACHYCSKPEEFLCDYPISKTKKGKLKTCDKPLCKTHTNKGISKNVDFCKEHFYLAKAAYVRRKQNAK